MPSEVLPVWKEMMKVAGFYFLLSKFVENETNQTNNMKFVDYSCETP